MDISSVKSVGCLLCLALLLLSGCSSRQPETLAEQPKEGVKFWLGDIGPIGPRFSGPHQYPFICTGTFDGLGQPLIDNQEGKGSAVFTETWFGPWIWGEPVGYSHHCSIRTRVDYFYYSRVKKNFLPLKSHRELPSDVARIEVNGEQVNFIVRVERGTINRFLYSIAMLAPYAESVTTPKTLNNSGWNGKLIYKFSGGVGIGHWQGRLRMDKEHALHYDALKRGYAVAFSSGTTSGTHHNITLSRETALMVKEHFVATYGRPQYTVGLGGSGGAIQQYLLAEQQPGLLDGAIAQFSYPDMLTQLTYVADCDLLERYFDARFQDDPDSKWKERGFRAAIGGLSYSDEALVSFGQANPYAPTPGASTCSRSWWSHAQTIMNPYWTHPAYWKALKLFRYPAEVQQGIKWTHWDNLAAVYPKDEQGYGISAWDNEGVQYGLQALREGRLSADEFLELNACVGGWKPSAEMHPSVYPWDPEGDPVHPDPWDALNMHLNPDCKTGRPAPRSRADARAVKASYASGQVFEGKVDIPVIDLRWYLDPALDIHHALGSFAARARIQARRGTADNQVIWVADCEHIDLETLEKDCPYDPTPQALDLMGQWLDKGKRPAEAVDSCFDHEGEVIGAGRGVWDGIVNGRSPGPCSSRFPVHATSRNLAGEPLRGDVLKCRLKPVASAVAEGDYGTVKFSRRQLQRLKEVFADGVCDYSGS